MTILAVRWDEISGPSIISIYPPSGLKDPESVALQIYLASVTVFGQHGHSQRTEFSVPLLSLGAGVTARVAFDSWEDNTIRGRERPFFLAFITENQINDILGPHLDIYIYEYLNWLKRGHSDFSSKDVWIKIAEGVITITPEEMTTFDDDLFEQYSIQQALTDLGTAKGAWEKLQDRDQLWTAMRVANRLENVDDTVAGDAFNLVGEIFLVSKNYHESKEAFERATDAFARVRLFKESGQTSALAGKCAFYLGNLSEAIELLQAGVLWIKEESELISVNFDMASALHRMNRFEEAYAYFEKSIKAATEADPHTAGEYSATYASRLMNHAEEVKEQNPALHQDLIRRSAAQRVTTAHLLTQSGYTKDAATSLILGAKAFLSLKDTNSGVEKLKEAADLFIEANDYPSAAKALYDGARNIKDLKSSYGLLTRASSLLENDETQQNYLTLGLIHFEKGKVETKRNQILESIQSFDNAADYLTQARMTGVELFSVYIQMANNLFRVEDFERAATTFFAAYKALTEINRNENLEKQFQKALLNSLISLRRASTVYHNAGIVALQNNEESRALELFSRSVSLLIEWIPKNPSSRKEEVQRIVYERLEALSLKLGLFVMAESKYKLNLEISRLKGILKVP